MQISFSTRLGFVTLLCLASYVSTGCAAFVRQKVNAKYPPLSAVAGKLQATRVAKATLDSSGTPTNIGAVLTRDFVTGWLEHALARPVLPDDPDKNPNAVQAGTSISGAVVTLSEQDVAAAARVDTTLCPDMKWTPGPNRTCIDPIKLQVLLDLHFAPYVVPARQSAPAVLAFKAHVARLQLLSLDLSNSRWARLNPLGRSKQLIAALNAGIDVFRDNISGMLEPSMEIKFVIEVDPKDFKEKDQADPTKDPFRIIVADARGVTKIAMPVRVSSGVVVATPDGLILLATVDAAPPTACVACTALPSTAAPSEEQFRREYTELVSVARQKLNAVVPGSHQQASVFAVRKDIIAALFNEHGKQLDWTLDITKQISSLEPDALCNIKNPTTGIEERKPCPPLDVRLDLKDAAFHCDDLCSEGNCKFDCSARERCTPYLISVGEKLAGDRNLTCPLKSIKQFVTSTVTEGCHQVCNNIFDPSGIVRNACHDEGCRTVQKTVEQLIDVADPVCVEARRLLDDRQLLSSEGGPLNFARAFGVEKQYTDFCTAVNSITERPACEAFKFTTRTSCKIAENHLNLLIGGARNKLGQLEYRYQGAANGNIAIRSLNVSNDLKGGSLNAGTTAAGTLGGHIKFVPEILIAPACMALETDLNNIQLNGRLKEETVSSSIRFGQKEGKSGLFLQPQGLTVKVETSEHPVLMLLKQSPSSILTCPSLLPIASIVPLYEIARTAFGKEAGPLEGVFSEEVKPGEVFSILDQEFEYLPPLKAANGSVVAPGEKVPLLFDEAESVVMLKPGAISAIPGKPLPNARRLTLAPILGTGLATPVKDHDSTLAVTALMDMVFGTSKLGAAFGFAPSPNLPFGVFLGASYRLPATRRWHLTAGVRTGNGDDRIRPFFGIGWKADAFGFVW